MTLYSWRVAVRSRLVVAGVLVFALEVPTLVEGKDLLDANRTTVIRLANGSAPLLIVLALVVGCIGGVVWRRHWSTVESLGPQAWKYPIVPALASAIVMSGAHVVWFAGVVIAGSPAGLVHHDVLLSIAVACLGISAACFVGATGGFVLDNWLAPPVLGVLGYAALIWTEHDWPSHLLGVGGVGSRLVGLVARPEVLVVQLVWFTSILVGSAWFLRAWAYRGWLRLFAVGGLVLPLLVVPAFSALGGERYELDRLSWQCSGARPTFCVLEEEAVSFARHESRFREASRRIEEAGVAMLDSTYWRRLSLPVPGHDMEFSLRARMPDREIVDTLMVGRFPCAENWNQEQWEALDRVVSDLSRDSLEHRSTAPRSERAGLSC